MSSRNISSSRKTTNTQLQEETREWSGWTTYLEDFSLAQNHNFIKDIVINYSNSSCSPSMVSDATSYAAWKKISDKNNTTNQQNEKRILNEELEDTGSSPVNSPKVSSGKQQMFTNQGRQNDVLKNGYTDEESKMST
ncbi:hypothetical protein Leryth_005667 [Lithospermum erythrorhizon]|nr:hypothetical protein Leryth_005667 [Lithospermum erythrorhizon]